MSGGHFNYDQFRITGIADEIASLIIDNEKEDEYGYSRNYTKETLDRFAEAEKVLRLAATMVHRIDWLLSCDDSEESFHKNWNDKISNKITLRNGLFY